MGQARIEIAPDILFQQLKFPSGCRLLNARLSDRMGLEIMVQHEELNPVDQGQVVPLVTPMFTIVQDGVDFNWGQE